MNTRFRLIALVLLAAALLACNPTTGDGTQTPTTALEGTEWRLVTLNGQAPLASTTITATFAQGQVAGFSGCNSYFGSYTLRGSALQFQGLGGTEMACLDPEGVMDQEQTFLRTLGEVASYHLADDQLILRDAQGNAVLLFAPVEPVPDAALEGTTWALTTFVDGDVATSLISGAAITLLLEDGTARGSAGCNDYEGKYTLQPGISAFKPSAAPTAPAAMRLWPQPCPTPARASYSATRATLGPTVFPANRATNAVSTPASPLCTSKPCLSSTSVIQHAAWNSS
jgi:heat shock protein HslJ